MLLIDGGETIQESQSVKKVDKTYKIFKEIAVHSTLVMSPENLVA